MKLFLLFLIGGVFPAGGKIATGGDELFNYSKFKFFDNLNGSEASVRDKCTIKLIKESINQFGSTYVYITDDRRHEDLLRDLQVNFVHSYFTRPKSFEKSQFVSFHNLQIFQADFKFQEILKRIQPLQSAKFFILVRNRREIIENFQILWNHRLVNVVGCYIADGRLYGYTFFPYGSDNCNRVGRLHLVRECDIENGIFSLEENLFPEKVRDLHRCHINVTFAENVPSSYYAAASKTPTGWEIDFLNEVVQRMNGVPIYKILPPGTVTYRTSAGYRRLLENSEIGGGLVISLRGLIYTDFCMYGKTLCTTWIVPKQENAHSAAFLIKVFPLNVWILLLAVYLTMACVIKAFYGSATLYNILFKLIPFLLGNGTRTKNVTKKLKALWICFCLFINAIYQSGYQSTLLVPSSTRQISTTKEVIESNLKIFGISDVITDAMAFFKGSSHVTGERLRLTRRRLSYGSWIYRMTVRKDSAFLGFKEIFRYHTDQTELAAKLHIQENCVVNYFLAYVLKKNSHLTSNFMKYTSRLTENGFLEYFIRKHLSEKSGRNVPKTPSPAFKPLRTNFGTTAPPPINFDKLFVVFVLHFSGNMLALFVFIFEKGKCDWKKVREAILKELRSAWAYND